MIDFDFAIYTRCPCCDAMFEVSAILNPDFMITHSREQFTIIWIGIACVRCQFVQSVVHTEPN